MITDARAAAEQFTRIREGGDKPAGKLGDPNHAYEGVNQSTYDHFRTTKQLPTQDVTLMSAQECADIYDRYWYGGACDQVATYSPELAVVHFDAEFNGGGAFLLRETAGLNPKGSIDQATLSAIGAICVSNASAAVTAYLQNRLDRFRNLKNPEAEPGWEKRLNLLAVFVGSTWRVS